MSWYFINMLETEKIIISQRRVTAFVYLKFAPHAFFFVRAASLVRGKQEEYSLEEVRGIM
jgi:hypothetical protein